MPPLYSIRGFTLTEILIVISIIGILASAVVINVSGSSAASRDAKRQSDLRNLQSAVETYRNENGRYPEACNGANRWSGEPGSNFQCIGGNTQYIVGLAPEYISVMPVDPRPNGTNSGYMYWTNADGSIYKIRAFRSVESEVVTYEHPLKPCDIRADLVTETSNNREIIGWCSRLRSSWSETGSPWPTGGGQIQRPHNTLCNPALDTFYASYAVWGGFLPKRNIADTCGAVQNCVPTVIIDTASVICR